MSKFKQIHGDNILQFRLRDQRPTSQSLKHDLVQPPASRKIKPISQAGPTPERNKEYVRLLASKGNPTQELVDECAPAILRRVLRHIRNRSRQSNHLPKTLPKVLRRQLQLLCDFDHPAGIVLRDWLDGDRYSLPDRFEEAYAASSKTMEAGHD